MKIMIQLYHFAILCVAIASGGAAGSIVEELLSEVRQSLNENEDQTCILALEELEKGFVARESWALEMVDANGKIASGLLGGNVMEFGNFEECIGINHEVENGTIIGKYCMNSFEMPLLSQNETLNLTIGNCLPHSCQSEPILKTISELVFRRFNVTLHPKSGLCQTDELIELRAIDYFVLMILCAIFLLVIGSTAYDLIKIRSGGRGNPRITLFSLHTNAQLLFTFKKSPDIIQCLNGIRALTIIWIVYCHNIFMSINVPYVNKIYQYQWLYSPAFTLAASGGMSVDAFFFLSGILITLSMMKKLKKGKKINLLRLYLQRYLRMTPALLAGVLIALSLIRYFGSGPYWPLSFIMFEERCNRYWWSTLLYTQNYVNPGDLCLSHTWYLSVDYQLFLLTPLIMYPLFKWRQRFIPAIVAIICISTAYCIYAPIAFNFKIGFDIDIFKQITDPGDLSSAIYLYYPTHTRATPWLIGMIFGYLVDQSRDQRTTLSYWKVITGWTLSFLLIYGLLFSGSVYESIIGDMATWLKATYFFVPKIFWITVIGWIVWACDNGYGGPINWFLSWRLWDVISRLTYSLYLVHYPIMLLFTFSVKNVGYFSNPRSIMSFWGYFGISLTVAVVWALIFEVPSIRISQAIVGGKGKDPAKDGTEIAMVGGERK